MAQIDPRNLVVNPKRLAELKAMPRCPECKALLKVCGGKH